MFKNVQQAHKGVKVRAPQTFSDKVCTKTQLCSKKSYFQLFISFENEILYDSLE